MNLIQHALNKISEEASELAQMAMKCQQFGLDEVQVGDTLHNYDRMLKEYQDLLSAMARLQSLRGQGFAPPTADPNHMVEKDTRVDRYLRYSIDLGHVRPTKEDEAWTKQPEKA